VNEDRWKSLQALFEAAANMPPDERDAYLERECSGDPDLRREVESLIASERGASGLIERALPRDPGLPTASATNEMGPSPGRQIDRYRILERIGGGGMGEVYLAEQREPVRRRVALKLIKWGMDTREVVARFESERQALAMMDHPGIARVLDGGATEEGRPYFVMEHVKGVPITEYCDGQRLSTRERLDLFVQVCEGVQHAHQKGVIHRDIKPSNVLVRQDGDRPVAKIIDFGVAKAISQQLTEHTVHTRLGQYVGTPEYMSPEQAGPSPLDIDTRTDVYSLGVMLYELLVGTKPLRLGEDRGLSLEEVLRRIREDEPSRPSARFSTLSGRETTGAARLRSTDTRLLRRQLRGDLDWIVMKALEKDRARRYGSPADLAADIRRHLRNEPVAAGPPGAAYRARKFVARHRVGVLAGAAVVLSALVGVAGLSAGLVRALRAEGVARDEAGRANQEADTAREVVDFLVDLFEVSDPGRAQGREMTAREILDEGSKRIDRELASQPLVRARLQETMSRVYYRLGRLGEARLLAGEAYETRGSLLGDDHPDTLSSLLLRAELEERDANYEESVELHRETLERSKRTLGDEHPITLKSLRGLGRAYHEWGRYEDAEPLFAEALTLARRTLGQEHRDTLQILRGLADVYTGQQRWEESLPLYREAAETSERIFGPDHPGTIAASSNVGNSLMSLGRIDDAEPLLLDALERRRRVLGEDHGATLWSVGTVGRLYIHQGRDEEATPLLREAFEGRVRWLGPDHARSLIAALNLGENLITRGLYDEAESLLLDTLERCRRALGEDNRWTHRALHLLGIAYHEQGRYEEAERHYLAALKARIRVVGENAWVTGNTRRRLIALYEETGRADEARALRESAPAESE
jgi:non-specific serine/threonine protein kinase/serine/threonine-protein kinase